MFEGKKNLFKGLYIYDKCDFENNIHPVINLTFVGGDFEQPGGLDRHFEEVFWDIADEHQISDIDRSKDNDFRTIDIIKKIYQKHNKKVVVLIDECDYPILSALFFANKELAASNNRTLNRFFSVLTSNPQYVRFVYITGLTKFLKVDMPPGLKNITDISLDPEYSTICGFTEKELKTVFAPEFSKHKNLSFDRVKRFYYGYNWNGDKQNKIYNPFGMVRMFAAKEIRKYWANTWQPTYLCKLLLGTHKSAIELGNVWVDPQTLSYVDANNIDIHSLFYQLGYLTIIDNKYDENGKETHYLLDYPNNEAKSSINKHLLSYSLHDYQQHDLCNKNAYKIIELLEKNDFFRLKNTTKDLFDNISFPWEGENIPTKPRVYESYYSSILYCGFIYNTTEVFRQYPELDSTEISYIELQRDNQVFFIKLTVLEEEDQEDNNIEQTLEKTLLTSTLFCQDVDPYSYNVRK